MMRTLVAAMVSLGLSLSGAAHAASTHHAAGSIAAPTEKKDGDKGDKDKKVKKPTKKEEKKNNKDAAAPK